MTKQAIVRELISPEILPHSQNTNNNNIIICKSYYYYLKASHYLPTLAYTPMHTFLLERVLSGAKRTWLLLNKDVAVVYLLFLSPRPKLSTHSSSSATVDTHRHHDLYIVIPRLALILFIAYRSTIQHYERRERFYKYSLHADCGFHFPQYPNSPLLNSVYV